MSATGGASDQHQELHELPQDLVPGTRWRRLFPGEERQLGAMRRWLRALLPDDPTRDDLACVATELASNAIRHTASGRGGLFLVEITWHESIVRIIVADRGGPTEPRVIDEPAVDHGRGLLLVRGLSVRAGVCGDQRGRLVWADLLWDGASAEHRLAPDSFYEAAIRDGEAALARRFSGVPAWFGRSTLNWWALAGPDGLVTASSAEELAGLLYRLAEATPPPHYPGTGFPDEAARDHRGARRDTRPSRDDAGYRRRRTLMRVAAA
jgi:serine/threonine-protein kinase RsbW